MRSNNIKNHLRQRRNARVFKAYWLIVSKGTDDGASALNCTDVEDKMGASANAKSLEGINNVIFTACGRDDKLFGDEYDNKGCVRITITSVGEGISDFQNIRFLLLPKVPSYSKLEILE